MKELREELDGESWVDPIAPKQRHGIHQRVQHHLCNDTRQKETDQATCQITEPLKGSQTVCYVV